MIINISESPRKFKRFRVVMNNNKYFDFGLKDGSTFIDHNDETKRLNYMKRHIANKTEKYLISNLIPSPALFSFFILWGPYNNIIKNINYLNNLWLKKENK